MTAMREAPAMQALLETVRQARDDVLDGKRPDAVARQRKRGKLTARERIARLCDAESFREVGGLVQPMREGDGGPDLKAPADGIVTGTGRIDGRLVWLCWRYGEESVGYYHDLDSGYAGRRPLTAEVRRTLLN